ncbi:hypothetical protein Q1695_006016 [Nippostrongylus brasiliensis]|nr:hypothetical protein Q1695_006016 [Nippostrongylus brasiliensis]
MGPDDHPINGTDLDRHVEAMLRDQSLPGHIRAVMAMLLEDRKRTWRTRKYLYLRGTDVSSGVTSAFTCFIARGWYDVRASTFNYLVRNLDVTWQI